MLAQTVLAEISQFFKSTTGAVAGVENHMKSAALRLLLHKFTVYLNATTK
jgi:hypothetical protein